MPDASFTSTTRVARVLQFASTVVLVDLLALSALLFGMAWSLPYSDNLKDFGSFVASGQAAAQGMDPYGIYPLTFHVSVPEAGLEVDAPNLNPPILLPAFEALSRLDPVAASRAWYVASLALYLLTLGLLIRTYPQHATPLRVLWALSLTGLWHTLEAGQIYMPLLLISAGAWVLLGRRRYLSAGLLIGMLVAAKPSFAVWPVLLLLAGHWAVGLPALACAVLLSVFAAVIYGPGMYLQWLAASRSFTGVLLPNASLMSIFVRVGLPCLGALAAGLLLIALAVWAWKEQPATLTASSLALVASLLASPITWPDYTLFLLPVLFGRRWSTILKCAAGLLAFPVPLVFRWFHLSHWHLIVLGSLYGWALLLVLATLASDGRAHQAAPAGGMRTL